MNDTFALEMQPPRERVGVYYGWIVLIVAALAMVATLPGRTLGLGLITEPLLADLKLARVDYGWMNLWGTLIGSFFSLACGPLIDRAGTRVVLTFNALLLGIVVLAMSHVHSALGLAVTLMLTRGLGQSALSVVSMAVVGKWFLKRINVAMGVYSAIVAIGFIAAIPSLQYAVQQSGWRNVWMWIGWALVAVLAPLAWLLVRKTPESQGLVVDGERKPHMSASRQGPTHADEVSFTLRQALLHPAFWVLAISCAVFNLIFSGVSLFAEAIVRERGFYDPGTFRMAMATLAMGGLVANVVGGWLAGRWPHGKLMAIGMAIVTVALLILPLANTQSAVLAYALTMGVAGGVITVVFFACWARAFGRLHLGKIQGAAQVLTVLASALGPVLLALGERHRGSYSATFLVLAPIVGALAVACWFVPVPTAAPTPSD
jgi:sugar phosphate permease